jgi:uncharacterized protein (TIGR04222 family)
MTSIATTWGISGPLFLWLYGGLCAAAAAAIWITMKRATGKAPRSQDPTPDLGAVKVAMLNGGPQLAITTAATRLMQEDVLRPGDEERTLVVSDGTLRHDADPLERAVLDAVRETPDITTAELRRELMDSEAIGWLERELTDVGLLIDREAARRLRRLWLWGAALALLGLVRIYAGVQNDKPVGYLAIAVAAVAAATIWLARRRHHATERGRAIVRAHRASHDALRRTPRADESVLAVALFGGAALWLAEPGFASALDVPREEINGATAGGWGGSYAGGGGGGCASGGASSCGGGGGGGGCGGGGCGGG